MSIDPFVISTYAPWGNAALAFEVGMSGGSVDETTGNYVPITEIVHYLAALKVERPSYQDKAGVDETTYSCSGRLLFPSQLDERITNGSQAQATINGLRGRFELAFDLAADSAHYGDLRQTIQGTFRMRGGT